jgi:hypothetical protein
MRALKTMILFTALVFAPAAFARNIHFVGTPTCSVVGTQLCCSGKVAGLGTAPTTVQVVSSFECVNRGQHTPPGQASGSTGPIPPSGGQITFSVCASGSTCPDDMTPEFGATATLNIFQNGNLVFSATIPVS